MKLIRDNKNVLVSLDNANAFKVLLVLSMIYLSIMICNAVLTNKYIGTDAFFILGGTLTSPFLFIIDDIVADIYGYKITRFMVVTGFAALTLFALICQCVLITPYPSFFSEQHAYVTILGSSLMWIDLSGCFSYLTANLLNSYVISQWKILIKGRMFWLRSLGASIFAEGIYTLLAIVLMELRSLPVQSVVRVIALSYLIKVMYSIIFSYPSQILVNYLKGLTQFDVYDEPSKFTLYRFVKYKLEVRK